MRTRRYYQSPEDVPTTRYIEHPFVQGAFLPVHRRPMRLAGVDCCSKDCVCFVTFNLRSRERVFVGQAGKVAWDALLEVRDFKGFTLHAACLMPDHVHLLVAPSGQGESVSDIVAAVKKRQQFQLRCQLRAELVWQDRFYDHVLGRDAKLEDEFEGIRWYIRQNPVRAQLVDDWKSYPFVL